MGSVIKVGDITLTKSAKEYRVQLAHCAVAFTERELEDLVSAYYIHNQKRRSKPYDNKKP